MLGTSEARVSRMCTLVFQTLLYFILVVLFVSCSVLLYDLSVYFNIA
jgi:hypothetical protein